MTNQTVLIRLKTLLKSGYHLEDYDSGLDSILLRHIHRKDLDLILYGDGSITDQSMLEREQFSISGINDDDFLKFVESLPDTYLFHRIFSYFFRVWRMNKEDREKYFSDNYG